MATNLKLQYLLNIKTKCEELLDGNERIGKVLFNKILDLAKTAQGLYTKWETKLKYDQDSRSRKDYRTESKDINETLLVLNVSHPTIDYASFFKR